MDDLLTEWTITAFNVLAIQVQLLVAFDGKVISFEHICQPADGAKRKGPKGSPKP